MFTDITIFTYIRNVKFNVQILNGSKALVKVFGLFIIKTPKKHNYTTLAIILYATKPTKYNQLNYTQTLH